MFRVDHKLLHPHFFAPENGLIPICIYRSGASTAGEGGRLCGLRGLSRSFEAPQYKVGFFVDEQGAACCDLCRQKC